ncbi:Ltp family lipoprotein [Microbacterium sp. T32]|uniref:Ltp family lipoprotein n=2 Tax=Bacillati TaxID=1783272 RepID=UPI0007B2A4E3|nr:Ltp family lipoprotein [Microbacterium sp. T32]KZE37935.1 hypothetical protein AVW09_16540 [Microbacterium sp. T32]
MTSPSLPPAGWYPDPDTDTLERYWDGQRWSFEKRPPLAPFVPLQPYTNGVGVAALIVGIVAAALAAIPYAIVLTWLITLAALVLGIIGLTLANRPRAAAGWGLALSILSVFIGVMSTSAVAGVTTPVGAQAGQVSSATDQPAPGAAEQPPAAAPPATDQNAVESEQPSPQQEQPQAPAPQAPAAPQPVNPAPPAAPQPVGTLSQRNAVAKAREYLNVMSFSRQGLIGQLEYEGFPTADAEYGVDTVAPDWNQQAAAKANEYLRNMSFSRQGLYDQLIFEKFTPEQADYAVAAVGF